MKPQYRIAHLLALCFIVAVLAALWQFASISDAGPPSILPGPIWLIKYCVPWKFLGSSQLTHILVGSTVTLLLVVGISAVLFRINAFTLFLAYSSLLIWIWIGAVMSEVIMSALGV